MIERMEYGEFMSWFAAYKLLGYLEEEDVPVDNDGNVIVDRSKLYKKLALQKYTDETEYYASLKFKLRDVHDMRQVLWAKEPDPLEIERVIYNDPATIVFWADGTKTVVKCFKDDKYDQEKGLAMAIAKKALGNKGNYYEVFKKWIPDDCELDIPGFDKLFLKYALEAQALKNGGK